MNKDSIRMKIFLVPDMNNTWSPISDEVFKLKEKIPTTLKKNKRLKQKQLKHIKNQYSKQHTHKNLLKHVKRHFEKNMKTPYLPQENHRNNTHHFCFLSKSCGTFGGFPGPQMWHSNLTGATEASALWVLKPKPKTSPKTQRPKRFFWSLSKPPNDIYN